MPPRTSWTSPRRSFTADGLRNAPHLPPVVASVLWVVTLFVGMMVLLPSQMSIVDDFSRRWTDVLWSANQRIRHGMKSHQVKYIYYSILSGYVAWSFFCAWLFSTYGTPKLMTLIIANFNNLALGATAILLLWVNRTLLPKPLRPRWYSQLGLIACGIFYFGLAALVFIHKQLPMLRELMGSGG